MPEAKVTKAARREAARREAVGKAVDEDVAAIATEAEAELAADDLDNPTTQWAILNPETLTYRLDFSDGTSRTLVVRTEFTMADAQKRRVFDELGALIYIVQGYYFDQMRRFDDVARATAVALSMAKEDARRIIVSMSHFEPSAREAEIAAADGREPRLMRPTIEQLTEGMSSNDTAALTDYLIVLYSREVERRKKARARPAASP